MNGSVGGVADSAARFRSAIRVRNMNCALHRGASSAGS